MKLLYFLPIMLGLCACDEKPIYTANNLECKWADKEFVITIPTKVEFYKDYAIVYEGLGTGTMKTEARLSEIYGHSEDTDTTNVYGTKLIVRANLEKNTINISTRNEKYKYDCYFKEGDSYFESKEIDKKSIEKIFRKHLN